MNDSPHPDIELDFKSECLSLTADFDAARIDDRYGLADAVEKRNETFCVSRIVQL
jgi:hypothetical protein